MPCLCHLFSVRNALSEGAQPVRSTARRSAMGWRSRGHPFCRREGYSAWSRTADAKVFIEPLPGTVARYSRRSRRSHEALCSLTLALGGRAGARLGERLGLLASRSTLLRELHHRRPSAPVQAPRVLGIDDWAWRKGHRYGTILCDLETRKVVDLLPGRNADTVAAWLRQHTGTEIISHDRGGIYAEAARRGAPQAVQVADRWHLLRNLSEALFRAIAPHHRLFSQVEKPADRMSPHPLQRPSHPGASASCWSRKPTGSGGTSVGTRYANSF